MCWKSRKHGQRLVKVTRLDNTLATECMIATELQRVVDQYFDIHNQLIEAIQQGNWVKCIKLSDERRRLVMDLFQEQHYAWLAQQPQVLSLIAVYDQQLLKDFQAAKKERTDELYAEKQKLKKCQIYAQDSSRC